MCAGRQWFLRAFAGIKIIPVKGANIVFGAIKLFCIMEFKERFESFARWGNVTCICIRPKRRGDIEKPHQAQAIADIGLQGDHYNNPGGSRQITLIQDEPKKCGFLPQ